jgi:transposase
VVNLDQMGPESAKSFRGQRLVRAEVPAEVAPAPMPPLDPTGAVAPLDSVATVTPLPDPPKRAERAKQEIDYGRRGKGYIFGAFQPANGEAFTAPYPGRTITNWVDFLEKVDDWIPAEIEHVYGILDNLNVHRATDVLLFSLGRPRWEFVFQPKYAAYLNLIEPWWKILRSLALKGRRFEAWAEVCQAVEEATAYWNAHRHPFVWGRRRRHQPKRSSGVSLLPRVA